MNNTACFVLALFAFFMGCKSNHEYEVDRSKKIYAFIKAQKLSSYDSLYNVIVLKRETHNSEDIFIDSLYRTTKKTVVLIDSISELIQHTDPTGERQDVGQLILINSPAGSALSSGAKTIQLLSFELTKDINKKENLNQIFSKYKGYLVSGEFIDIYFSQSSSSFILMYLAGLKVDFITATYIGFAERV